MYRQAKTEELLRMIREHPEYEKRPVVGVIRKGDHFAADFVRGTLVHKRVLLADNQNGQGEITGVYAQAFKKGEPSLIIVENYRKDVDIQQQQADVLERAICQLFLLQPVSAREKVFEAVSLFSKRVKSSWSSFVAKPSVQSCKYRAL